MTADEQALPESGLGVVRPFSLAFTIRAKSIVAASVPLLNLAVLRSFCITLLEIPLGIGLQLVNLKTRLG